MIPSVFVSSTIKDLRHLREQIGVTLSKLGYIPVLSENGDVGYLPSLSAVDSCFVEIKQCQLAVLIIGKSYGSLLKNGFSVTHMEFRAAREQQIPTICLVEQDVLSLKKVYESNTNKGQLRIPDMDNPEKTFMFIQEVMDSPVSNGIHPFGSVSDAQASIKKQLAHIFADLLRRRLLLLSLDVKDATAESVRPPLAAPRERPDSLIVMLKRALEDRGQPFLAVALDGAREVIFAGKELYIEFAPEARHLRDMLGKPRNIGVLKETSRALFKSEVSIRISIKEQSEGDDEKKRLRLMAEQHPLVQQVLKTFRSEIIDVRVVDDAKS